MLLYDRACRRLFAPSAIKKVFWIPRNNCEMKSFESFASTPSYAFHLKLRVDLRHVSQCGLKKIFHQSWNASKTSKIGLESSRDTWFGECGRIWNPWDCKVETWAQLRWSASHTDLHFTFSSSLSRDVKFISTQLSQVKLLSPKWTHNC